MAENPAPTKQTSIDPNTLALYELINQGKAGTGVISAPQGQQNIVMENKAFDPKKPEGEDNRRFFVYPSPNNAPSASSSAGMPTTYSVPGVGVFAFDPKNPNANPTMLVGANAPNADEEISKYYDRVQKEQLATQRQNNEKWGLGYATDDDIVNRTKIMQELGISRDQVKAQFAKIDEDARQFDKNLALESEKAKSTIGLQGAQAGLAAANTTNVGAQTSELQQKIEQSAQRFPTDLAQAKATLAGTEQNTATSKQAMQIAGASQLEGGLTSPYLTQRDPLTGAITQTGMNLAFQPKTQADVAARIGQIQSAAQAKQQEVLAKVGKNGYTADNAGQEFNQWWDQQVAPQQESLKAAQAQAIAEQQRLDMAQRASAYQTAVSAGNMAANAFTAGQAGRVGPNFQAANQAASAGDFKALGNISGATGYTATPPDSGQALMDALKYISPTAAQATNSPMPNYAGADIGQALNRGNYNFGGPAAPAAPAAMAAPAAPAAPAEQPAPDALVGAPPVQNLLPAGWAGRQGFDPNLTGQLNPNLFSLYNDPNNPLASNYVYGGV